MEKQTQINRDISNDGFIAVHREMANLHNLITSKIGVESSFKMKFTYVGNQYPTSVQFFLHNAEKVPGIKIQKLEDGIQINMM